MSDTILADDKFVSVFKSEMSAQYPATKDYNKLFKKFRQKIEEINELEKYRLDVMSKKSKELEDRHFSLCEVFRQLEETEKNCATKIGLFTKDSSPEELMAEIDDITTKQNETRLAIEKLESDRESYRIEQEENHLKHMNLQKDLKEILDQMHNLETEIADIMKRYETADQEFKNEITSQTIETANKIAEFIKEFPESLIISNSCSNREHIIEALVKQDIQVSGPIRESLKPRGFLWEVKKTDQVVAYLLGSIHVTPNWVLENLNSEIMKAFSECDTLGVELDVTNPVWDEYLKEHESKNKLPLIGDDEKTKKVVDLIKYALKDLEIDLECEDPSKFILEGFSQWSKTISKNASIESGIDFHFLNLAKEREIEVVDLESTETHYKYKKLMDDEEDTAIFHKLDSDSSLDNTSIEERYQQMKSYFIETQVKPVSTVLPNAYELGYLPLIKGLSGRYSEERRNQMNARNMEMALSIINLISNGKKPFAIAGAAHFGGDMGIDSLLTKLGYSVRQVLCEEPRQELTYPNTN